MTTNAHILLKAAAAVPILLIGATAYAGPDDDAALAKAKKQYEAAMKGSDVGLQNSARIQLAVLQGRSGNGGEKAAAAVEMPPLAHELNCVACHAIDHKIVGPAWRDVANRYTGNGVTTYTYQGKQYPLIDGLVMKVSKGGNGNWGTMPMPANDPTGVKRAKIMELIQFEQGLAGH